MANQNFIRNMAMPFAGLLMLAGTMVSCNDDDADTTTAITEAEAVDAIEASIASESNGVAKMATEASTAAAEEEVYTDTPALTCGQLYSEAFNAEAANGGYSYDYTGARSYQLSCSTVGVPESFSYSYDMDGTYDTPRMYSNDNAEANVSITGLSPASGTASISGSYVRNGHQESKVHQMREFDSVITYSINTLTVNKTSQLITGGTAGVSITGVGSTGNSFSYSGTLTFNGDQTATLVLNGTTYSINL